MNGVYTVFNENAQCGFTMNFADIQDTIRDYTSKGIPICKMKKSGGGSQRINMIYTNSKIPIKIEECGDLKISAKRQLKFKQSN